MRMMLTEKETMPWRRLCTPTHQEIWVAAEMRAGGAYAHSNLAIDTMQRLETGASA